MARLHRGRTAGCWVEGVIICFPAKRFSIAASRRGEARPGSGSSSFYLSIYLTASGGDQGRRDARKGKQERERKNERQGEGRRKIRGSGEGEAVRVGGVVARRESPSGRDAVHEHRSALRGVLWTSAGHRRAILGVA